MSFTGELINANIYLKDGQKKYVSILNQSIGMITEKINFISNGNLEKYLVTGNTAYVESLEMIAIDGIDVDLK